MTVAGVGAARNAGGTVRDHAVAQHDRRIDVQGLRGVAVLLVVLFHLGVGPRAGFLGVDVFFVISGFVIGRRLDSERARTGSVRLRSFYARRVRRLLPAMAVFLVVTPVLTSLVLSPFGPQQLAFGTAAAAAAFGANVHLYRHTGYFDASAETNPFLHTWSLSVEEQLYVALPALVVLVWGLASRRGTPIGQRSAGIRTLAAAGVVSLSFALLLTSGAITAGLEAPARLAFYAMPTRAWQFVAGMLLAFGAVPVLRGPARAWVGGLGLIGVLVASVMADPLAPHPAGWAVVVVVATVALLAAGGRGSPVDRLLGARPLVALGDVSYGWYLWHWPAIALTRVLWPDDRAALVVAAVVALVPAALSHRFVERPVMFGAAWRGPRTAALALACIAVPLLTVAALDRGASGGWGLDQPLGWYDHPETRDSGCHVINRDMPNTFDLGRCTFGPDGADDRILVVGDETADSVAPAVIEAGRARGWRTVQSTRAGCPALDGVAPAHYPRCEEWQDDVFALVEELDPAALVVAHRSSTYDRLEVRVRVGGEPQPADDSWSLGLHRLVERMERRGVPVLVVAELPDFGLSFPGARISVLQPEPSVPTLHLDDLEAQRGARLAAERGVVVAHERAELVDPAEVLCREVCRPVEDGEWRYLGPSTLNAAGALMLADPLGDWLSANVAR